MTFTPRNHYNIPPKGINWQRGAGQAPPANDRKKGFPESEISRQQLLQRNIQLALDLATTQGRLQAAEQELATLRQQCMQPGLFDGGSDGDARAQAAEAALAQARAELEAEKQARDWERRLLINRKLDPAARLSLWASAALIKEGKVQDSRGLVRVRNEDLEERAGLPRSTSLRISAKLEAAGFVISANHDDEHLTLPNGKPLPNRYMNLSSEACGKPELLAFPNAPKRGGYRLPCAVCGGSRFKVEKQTLERRTCLECGDVREYEGEIRTSSVGLETNAPAQTTPPMSQNETQESEAWDELLKEQEGGAEREFLLPGSQNGMESLGSHFETTAMEEKQEPKTQPQDAVLAEEADPSGETLAELAVIPFAPVLVPLPDMSWVETLTDQEAQDMAVDLLVDLNAEQPVHIEMLPKDPIDWQTGKKKVQKYTEVKKPLSRDIIEQHFTEGCPARGVKQRRNAETTRGFSWDADAREKFAILDAIGSALMEAGIPAMLDRSPAVDHHAGGGHLWVLYDGSVNVKAALAQLYAIEPELRNFLELWPLECNMRLPGGYFTRPGVAASCTLRSCVTDEEVQQGPALWRMLLSHQYPASKVPALPPEPEKPTSGPTLNRAAVPATRFDGFGGAWIPDLKWEEVPQAFNSLYRPDDIHPRTTRDKGYALDREETQPSLHYNDSGQYAGKCKDFGQGPGKGWYDAFGLECLINWGGNRRDCWNHWKKQLTGLILQRRAVSVTV